MDPSYNPFEENTVSDDDSVHSKLNKGKQEAEDSDTDSELQSDFEPRPIPSLTSIDARPITDGVATGGSDSDESLYQFLVEKDLEGSESERKAEDSDSAHSTSISVVTGGSDGVESLYQSTLDEYLLNDQTDVGVLPDELDLAYSIRGMYRILDLISEQGAGGLVDKIIIAQDSLEAFLNCVCPGAYVSTTKVNFKALDDYVIKPVGIYESKEEIVRFLLELEAIDETIAAQLLVDSDTDARTQPALRSGLYIITIPEQTGEAHQIFVLYWPEQTTWDDFATSSVRRNRIMFMRYLTKICDQVVALISSDHAQTILWSEEDGEDEDMVEVDYDESDRMYAFEVAETNEQEETVSVRKGFKATSPAIVRPEAPGENPGQMKSPPIAPFLLFGETAQGLMTVEYREARDMQDAYKGISMTGLQLGTYLESDRLCLSEQLDEEAVRILVNSGLEKRFSQCRQWKHETAAVRNMSQSSVKAEIRNANMRLQKGLPALQRSMFEAILDELLRLYPCFDRDAFLYSGDNAEKPVHDPEPFSERLTLYPRAKDEVGQQLSQAVQSISDQEFRAAKDLICFFKELMPLLKKKPIKLDEQYRVLILEAVLEANVDQANVKGNNAGGGGGVKALFVGQSDMEIKWDDLFQRATDAAGRVTDSQFLTQLEEDLERFAKYGHLLKPLADKAKERAFDHLEGSITKTTKKLMAAVHRIQEEDCAEGVKREQASRAEEEQRKLRMDLIRQIYIIHRRGWGSSTNYRITGSRASRQEPMVMYTVHVMNLTTEDQHELQLNPIAIPSPRFRFRHTFNLPLGNSVIRAQLLEAEKLLLVVTDHTGNLFVYFDALAAMAGTIARGRGKSLNREKIGQDF
ncbi:hypothetical protein OG21DRAFT_1607071, partial [Imleria badia]